jgi:hypothetical protein
VDAFAWSVIGTLAGVAGAIAAIAFGILPYLNNRTAAKSEAGTARESFDIRKAVLDWDSQMRVDADMRSRDEALRMQANEFVANKSREIIDAQLQEWAKRVEDEVRRQRDN